jgi:RNA polymerase sigma-70 factor, ECF subfamily
VRRIRNLRIDATPTVSPGTEQLSALFEAHADFVHRALLRFGVPTADVEDALQDVFLVVARRLDGYVERGAMRAWLFVIARQVALHALRAGRLRARQTLLLVRPAEPDDPHAKLLQQEAVAMMHGFLAQLDEKLAEVFVLAEIEQLSVPEIAAALRVKLNTAYSRLRLARRRFEKWLAQVDEVRS